MESIEQYYIYISSAFAGILLAIGYIGYKLRKLNNNINIIRDDIDTIHTIMRTKK